MALKQDSLVRGTIILAVAAFVARFLGLAQAVPIQHILGDSGIAVYRLANNLYLTLLPLATAGIPSALSKLIAEKIALGRQQEADHLFRVSIRFAMVAGVVITVPLIAIAPLYASLSKLPGGKWAIWAIAPALLLFPVIAMLRGYFQGRQMMMAGGMSQIWEQVFRVATSVAFTVALAWAGYNLDLQAAGASFGGVIGAGAALAVMLFYLRKLRRDEVPAKVERSTLSESKGESNSYSVFMGLLKLSIPISLYSSTVSLINLLDNSIGTPLLQYEMSLGKATDIVGQLTGRAQVLAGIAVVFAVAVSQSLVPVVSAAFSRGDLDEVRRKGRQALLMALLSGFPIVAMLVAGAVPINLLLFKDGAGSSYIALLSVATIFQIMMMTSGAILMGMGRMRMLMLNLAVCVVVKLLFSVLLAPTLLMPGIITATGLCYLASFSMNLIYLKRTIGLTFLGQRWISLGLTVIGVGVVGYLAAMLNTSFIHPFIGKGLLAVKGNAFLQCVVVGLLVCVVYGVLLFATRLITKEELASMPRPLKRVLGNFGLKVGPAASGNS